MTLFLIRACLGRRSFKSVAGGSSVTRWFIQNTPGTTGPRVLASVCQELGIDYELGAWGDGETPSLEPPTIPVFYGSCRFIANLVRLGVASPGLFSRDSDFNYRSYLEHYGCEMLNGAASLMRLDQLNLSAFSGKVFLRSAADNKEITGSIWTVSQLALLLEKLKNLDPEALSLEVVCAPKQLIEREWRVFVVDGSVSTGSQYMHFGELACVRELPDEVTAYAGALAKKWAPSSVFVMDVALVNGQLRVVELNGFNSSGFYLADVRRIVMDVEHALRSCPGVRTPG